MNETLLILVLIVGVIAVVLLMLVISMLKKSRGESVTIDTDILAGAVDKVESKIVEEGKRGIDDIARLFTLSGQSNVEYLKSTTVNIKNLGDNQINTLKAMEKNIGELTTKNDQAIRELRKELSALLSDNMSQNRVIQGEFRQEINQKLTEIEQKNTKNITEIKEVVDEKLTATINERFNKSFVLVTDRLDAITKGFGEIQSLTSGVTDLKRVLFNVKTRGVWGENSLENLLEQVMAPEQYGKQVMIDKRNQVDFAIKLPGKADELVYLPIDAKFPIEDYQRLVTASENADIIGVEESHKQLLKRIKLEAKSISGKYIVPPKTTDFAIMYLPIEGLYAEVLREDGLVENLQNAYRVIIAGPTTIAALLNSLQMGFKTLAIQKSSSQIWKLFADFRKQFNTFSGLLAKTSKKLEEVTDTIEKANKSSESIKKKLDKASRLVPESERLDTSEVLEIEEELN